MKKIIFTLMLLLNSFILAFCYSDKIDYKGSTYLSQHEYTSASCEKNVPLITTSAVAGCIFVIVYDTKQKLGLAAHWDDDTRREDLEELFKLFELAESKAEDLKVYLIGGWNSTLFPYSKKNAVFLEKFLKNKNIITINKDHLFEKKAVSSINQYPTSSNGFAGISFNICKDEIKLSDTQKSGIVPTYWPIHELDENVPNSGDPLIFVKAKLKKKQTRSKKKSGHETEL